MRSIEMQKQTASYFRQKKWDSAFAVKIDQKFKSTCIELKQDLSKQNW